MILISASAVPHQKMSLQATTTCVGGGGGGRRGEEAGGGGGGGQALILKHPKLTTRHRHAPCS